MLKLLLFLIMVFNVYNIECELDNNDTKNEYDKRFINLVIRQLFELFRGVVKDGCVEKDIPVLDPYQIKEVNVNIIEDLFRVAMNISRGTFMGLGNYELLSFNFDKSDVTIQLNLNMPHLLLTSELYELKGNVYNALPISGQGKIHVEIWDTNLTGKVHLKQSVDEKSVLINYFRNLHFTVDSIKSQTQFDDNIDIILNSMITDLSADYFSRFSGFICKFYGDTIVRHINEILSKFETWKMIAIIL